MKAGTSTTGQLGVSIAEQAFIRTGFAFRSQTMDFGIDAVAEFRDDDDLMSGQLVAMQIKCGDSYLAKTDGDAFVFSFDKKHHDYWIDHVLPVIIVLVDPETSDCYWEMITAETVVSTGKRYKVLVPKAQLVNQTRVRLGNVVTKIVPAAKYTVVGPEDISHGLAKRYSFKILLHESLSKREVATVMRQVTFEGAERKYYRSELTAAHWGDSDATVVWTYVYPTAMDYENSNCAARSQWINPHLDESAGPGVWTGEDHGDGFVLIWNDSYELISELHLEHTLTKEEFLPVVDLLLETFRRTHLSIAANFKQLATGALDEADFIALCSDDFAAIDEATNTYLQIGIAPLDCSAVKSPLDSVQAHMYNIALFFTNAVFLKRDPSNRLLLAKDNLNRAADELASLEYERRKVT